MKRLILITTFCGILLLILAAGYLKSGMVETSWGDLWKLFTAPDSMIAIVIRELRLPRMLTALLTGSSLALAGVILQKVLRNELASPDILGISGGAGCAGVTMLLLFPMYAKMLNFAVFAGALTASLLICLAAWKRGFSPVRLILAGVALGALFNTASGMILLNNSDKFPGIMEFTIGGFSTAEMDKIYYVLPFFAGAFLLAAGLSGQLDLLSLGSEEARSLGLPLTRCRILALTAAALAAAAAVSLAGLLGFVGLMAPHIAAKLLDSERSSRLLTVAPLLGALLTLSADFAAKTFFAPRELPCGIILSGLGALFFLILLWNKRGEI